MTDKPIIEAEVLEVLPRKQDGGGNLGGNSPKPRRTVGLAGIIATFVIAAGADGFQWVFPPLWWLADGLAFLGLLAIWGLRIEILLFLIPELIPGVALFPTWMSAALVLVARHAKK